MSAFEIRSTVSQSENLLQHNLLDRRVFLGTLAGAVFSASAGCSEDAPPRQTSVIPQSRPQLSESERVQKVCEWLRNENLATTEILHPERPMLDPIFVVEYFHPASLNGGTEAVPRWMMKMLYMDMVVLGTITHMGFNKVGIEGYLSTERLEPVQVYYPNGRRLILEGSLFLGFNDEHGNPPYDEKIYSKALPSDILDDFADQDRFTMLFRELQDMHGGDARHVPGAIFASICKDPVCGIENKALLEMCNREIQETFNPLHEFGFKLVNFLKKGGQPIYHRENGKLAEIEFGEQRVPVDYYRRAIEFFVNDEPLKPVWQRERENYMLALPLDVAMIGRDHFSYLARTDVERTVILVKPRRDHTYRFYLDRNEEMRSLMRDALKELELESKKKPRRGSRPVREASESESQYA